MSTAMTHTRRRVAAGSLVALCGLLVGCGAGGSSSTDSAAPASVQAGGVARPELGTADKAAGAPRSVKGANRPAVQTRAVISTGTVDLTSKDVAATRASIDRLLGRYGGYVGSEQTDNRPDGTPGRSTLVLRFPATEFDTVMDALEDPGRLADSNRKSDDVTTQVIDVDTRVATAQASIKQLRKFLRQATDVNDMITLESEIATRQADLESMLAQQKYLEDATSMATITVHLSTRKAHAAPPGALDDAGFLAGLRAGWHGLTSVLVVTATVLGAVLPFGVVLALVVVPLWFLLRALLRRRRTVAPPAATEG